MSALFLLMIPPVALAAYRALAQHRLGRGVAAGVALVFAVAVTALPAWALRTKASHGSPAETPVGPGFRGGSLELLVDYVNGWSAPEQVRGQTVRRLSGHGQLAVGPSPSRRPRSTLSLRAWASEPTSLAFRYRGATLVRARVTQRPSRVAVPVAAGTGPAVFDVDVGAGATIVVPVSSVHAVVAR